jgi:primase-polymerase (primpol)-like protein
MSSPPFNAETGEFAKSNDKSTWSSYETAVNAEGVDGIGSHQLFSCFNSSGILER